MSKGNPFMGQMRGKVGDVVMARVKGQQTTRAYNGQPANPKSSAQMLQRAIFASAVRFFTKGRQAFFQFAFEDKKVTESDYNAFMRHNAKRGVATSQAALQEATYPIVSPFVMSAGSLPEIPVTYLSESDAFNAPIAGLTQSDNFGGLSRVLINNYGFLQGDIITICIIEAVGSTAENTPAVAPEKRGNVKWTIRQAVLDMASTESVTAKLGAEVTNIDGALAIVPATVAENATAVSVTMSRNTENGLRVSDTILCLDTIAQQIYEAEKAEAYVGDVLASWKASGKAILQGSLANGGSEVVPVVTHFNNDPVPYAIQGNHFIVSDSTDVQFPVRGTNLSGVAASDFDITYKINNVNKLGDVEVRVDSDTEISLQFGEISNFGLNDQWSILVKFRGTVIGYGSGVVTED